ncbi:hypothetical protein DTL42_00130 [Bremerella cremea]|uniref:DUF2007 domain-containing protein n=1 Tax=Bremerella cremea TaxID=1031537 RepID=A0A368KZ74_9BACT|nr:DUF2007 domain-containing protein [Bremerella cremea]RCS56169.1 hypothetical protein DTL42_00130 [Bremerella cremea]
MENNDLVPVRTCQSHEEATIIQNAMEGEGFSCVLDNDHQGGLTGVLAIRLMVPADQLARAKAFLDEHHAD